MKKNNLYLILVIIIVLLSVTATCIITLSEMKKKSNTDMKNETTNQSETIAEEVIVPENSYLFFGKYISKNVTTKEIYESIYNYGINQSHSKLVKIEFDEDSIDQHSAYTSAKIIYTYENGETIDASIKVLVKKTSNSVQIN